MRARILGVSIWLSLFAALPGMAQSGPDWFTNTPLTTQDGKVVHLYDDLLKGKSVVVNLIYTRCTASCPLETAKLSQVQKLLGDRVGKDIFFYSISIDPKHDTPEVLKAYAARFHAGPGWLFLTGAPDGIKLVSKRLGLASLTDAANRDGHQPSLMVGNEPSGQWMRNSAVDNPRFLAATIVHFIDGYSSVKQASYADVSLRPVGKGEYLFKSRCAACHTVGGGNAVGPDLVDVQKRRDRAWLTRYVTTPDVLLAQRDPIALALFEQYRTVRMPNLDLAVEDADAILHYVELRSRAAAGARSATGPRTAAAAPEIGGGAGGAK
ncbi:MAG TPA: SCO family protein [Myxococcales bacterium]|jgi:protein SCO1/2